MEETVRITRSATRSRENQRVDILTKTEEDTETTKGDFRQIEPLGITSLDPIVKVKKNAANPRAGSEKGLRC